MARALAACGNLCAACPRCLPRTRDELARAALLRYQIGHRDAAAAPKTAAAIGRPPVRSAIRPLTAAPVQNTPAARFWTPLSRRRALSPPAAPSVRRRNMI